MMTMKHFDLDYQHWWPPLPNSLNCFPALCLTLTHTNPLLLPFGKGFLP